jgi:hypothetical protein
MAMRALAAEESRFEGTQLGLYEERRPVQRIWSKKPAATLCAGCRAKDARYGFQEQAGTERPNTLCFECFRMELDRRQRVAAQLARGWNAHQAPLPLAETLKQLTLRRRRAQIAARRFVGS